jgi:hypothetical protein
MTFAAGTWDSEGTTRTPSTSYGDVALVSTKKTGCPARAKAASRYWGRCFMDDH